MSTHNFLVEKRKLYLIIALFIYKIILDLSLAYLVVPNFYIYNLYFDINILKLIESYLYLTIFIVVFIAINRNNHKMKPSILIVYLLFVFLICPLLTAYGLLNGPRLLIYFILIGFLIVFITIKLLPTMKVPVIKNRKLIVIIITLFTVYVYFTLIRDGGLSRFSLSVTNVYDTRGSYLVSRSGLNGYFITWQANIINMMLLSYWLYYKKYLKASLALFAQVLLFGMTGFKSFLFAPILILGIVYFFKRQKSNNHSFLFNIALWSSLTILLSFIHYRLANDVIVASIFVRRLFFVPPLNHFFYYDFFKDNDKLYLSNSIFSNFIDYPYSDKITNVISLIYYGSEGGPNVGIFGDAFAQFGLVGIILFSIILGYLLKLLDSVASNLPIAVTLASVAIPAISLVNSSFFTVLISHGFLMSILFVWLLNASSILRDKK